MVELLVVVGIIAVLIAILLPALRKAREQAKNVQCQSNLRNCGQALIIYANANKGKLPQHTGTPNSGAGWLWDVSFGTRDAMVKNGATRHTLYCPFYNEQDADALWNYKDTGNYDTSYAVMGYFFLFARLPATSGASLIGREYLPTINPHIRTPNAPTRPAEIELATDAVTYQNGRWSGFGGWNNIHVTPHMERGIPTGSNILFLDGHVGWRPFKLGYTDNAAITKLPSEMQRRAAVGSVIFYF